MRKCVIELILVKVYEKMSCISFGKDTKEYNKSDPKTSKDVFGIVYPV